MGKARNTSTAGKKRGKGKSLAKGGKFQGKTTNNSTQHHHKKVEITFDPTSRRDYLTGFSSRKKERRAFGLAMQKVKDRQAKLDERKDTRAAQLEKVEEIERNKKELRGINNSDGDGDGDYSLNSEDNDSYEDERETADSSRIRNDKELTTFQDEQTAHQFGGFVSVTTTFGIPSDDDDDSVNSNREFYARKKHGSNHVDEEQKRAGNVNNYIAKVKGSMNGTKKIKKHGGGGKKGQHGAAGMKGMGSSGNVKMAKKTLAKFKAKNGETGNVKGKRKKGKGR